MKNGTILSFGDIFFVCKILLVPVLETCLEIFSKLLLKDKEAGCLQFKWVTFLTVCGCFSFIVSHNKIIFHKQKCKQSQRSSFASKRRLP
jgi:hypothetical protein